MKRSIKIAAVTLALTAASASAAFASGWQKNDKGWWYSTNADNSSWHANGWQWVDGNGDGVAECYYFDANGYCLMNTTTPDGYKVDSNGAWLVNGAVQMKKTGSSAASSSDAYSGKYTYQYNINDFGKWKGIDRDPFVVEKQDNDHVLINGELYTRMSDSYYGAETFGRQTNDIYDGYVTEITFDTSTKMLIFHGEEEGDSYYMMNSKQAAYYVLNGEKTMYIGDENLINNGASLPYGMRSFC